MGEEEVVETLEITLAISMEELRKMNAEEQAIFAAKMGLNVTRDIVDAIRNDCPTPGVPREEDTKWRVL
jgi:hypothetical protein